MVEPTPDPGDVCAGLSPWKYIRKRGKLYDVRIPQGGSQVYHGSEASHEAAIALRNVCLKRDHARTEAVRPAARRTPTAGVRRVPKGVGGHTYDVAAYIDGHYKYGGRHATLEAAIAARTQLSLTPTDECTMAAAGGRIANERGIQVRYGRKRGAARSTPPAPRFLARAYGPGAPNGAYLGTFDSIDEARAAIATATLRGSHK